jgi:hypothetical protein
MASKISLMGTAPRHLDFRYVARRSMAIGSKVLAVVFANTLPGALRSLVFVGQSNASDFGLSKLDFELLVPETNLSMKFPLNMWFCTLATAVDCQLLENNIVHIIPIISSMAKTYRAKTCP